jgi:hypothetical protein
MLRDAQGCSPSAQVKAAAAHVQTLKRNQRKKKLSLTYLVETNEPAIPFANTIKPLVGDTFTFIIDYYFAGSSIPNPLLTTTLTLPPSPLTSIPASGFGQFHAFQRTNRSL